MSIIKTQDLNYIYGLNTPFEKKAISNINLEIEKGEFIGVIGHTGSGKSTLIQHFNGLLKPSSGKIFIDGEDIWENEKNMSKYRFKVGLVFQYPEYQLFEETVEKDIAFGPKNMGLDENEISKRVKDAAKFVGLNNELLKKSPFDLSGGQKRRVAIAGVISMEPEVLILDEPAAGLDPKGRDKILNEIKEYHNQKHNTVLLVSHSMEDIAKYATKVLVMNKSEILMYDTVDNVFAQSDKLSKIGLDIPEISRVFLKLREMGYPVNCNIYTLEQAQKELLSIIG